MELWLALSAWAMGRALPLAEKLEDYDTIGTICNALRIQVEAFNARKAKA